MNPPGVCHRIPIPKGDLKVSQRTSGVLLTYPQYSVTDYVASCSQSFTPVSIPPRRMLGPGDRTGNGGYPGIGGAMRCIE
jgi:hypothetical protein